MHVRVRYGIDFKDSGFDSGKTLLNEMQIYLSEYFTLKILFIALFIG